MPGKSQSFDERVARNVINSVMGEAGQVAQIRGMPPELRYATPDEEILLFYQWDDKVNPLEVLAERFKKHLDSGMPEDGALTEAVLEASAAGYTNKLKLAQSGDRVTSLVKQTKYLEDMAAKYPRYLELRGEHDAMKPPDQRIPTFDEPAEPATDTAGSFMPEPMEGV